MNAREHAELIGFRRDWDSRMDRAALLSLLHAGFGKALDFFPLTILACVWLGLYLFAWSMRRWLDRVIAGLE